MLLGIPDLPAHARVLAEYGGLWAAAQQTQAISGQCHPVADKLLHLHGHPKVITQQRSEAFGIAHLGPQASGKMQLGHVRQRVATQQRCLADPQRSSRVTRLSCC